MKRWNRKNELLADSAERATVAAWWMGGRPYPSQKLEDAWYLLLGSQMHDILPGTSVPRAYDFAWNDECIAANQFSGVLEDAAASVISGMDTKTVSDKATTLVVYNPLSVEREDVVEADVPFNGPRGGPLTPKVTGPDGKTVEAQLLDNPATPDGAIHIAFLAKAPPVGFAAYSVELASVAPAQGSLRVTEHELEKRLLPREARRPRRHVSSIHDKKANKELPLRPRHPEASTTKTPPTGPPGTRTGPTVRSPPRASSAPRARCSFRIVEHGPARVAVEVIRSAEGSTFTQHIRLSAGTAASRIEFDTDIDWLTRERSVRAAFPLTVSNATADYDIQTEPPCLQEGNGHAKQFEYSFHQWFDLTDSKGDAGGYGATVMCDSKYGADKPSDNTVRLTLLHTPGTRGGYPDQGSQDLGRHHILYAIEGHSGTWQHAHTYTQAARLNQPLAVFTAAPHAGPLGKTFSLAHTSDPAVTISANKKAEDSDEVIVRLREQTGSPAKGVHLAFAKPILSAREVDGQEREVTKARVEGGQLVADISPFELRAFALKLGDAPAQLAKDHLTTRPPHRHDTDVVSTIANCADGAIDGQGNSLPAEQFPATITDGMVTFTLGKTADGQKNAVSCQGQEIKLPEGDFDTLYVLAAADGDVTAPFTIDGNAIPTSVQAWNGFVGQWDHRLWPGDSAKSNYPWNRDFVGLEPGFIKPDAIAWFCSHHHMTAPTPGNAIYEIQLHLQVPIRPPQGRQVPPPPHRPQHQGLRRQRRQGRPLRHRRRSPLRHPRRPRPGPPQESPRRR